MPKEIISTGEAPRVVGPYSQAVKANGLVFLSGQIPIDPKSGEIVCGDIRAQTRRVLENLKAVLGASGSSVEKVVKTTVYLADMNDFAQMNEVYAEYFDAKSPARETVEVARLPKDVLVEIAMIAMYD